MRDKCVRAAFRSALIVGDPHALLTATDLACQMQVDIRPDMGYLCSQSEHVKISKGSEDDFELYDYETV